MSYLNWAKQNSDQLPQMTCELVLGEHEPSSYKAGDTINGHLLLNTSQPFYVYGTTKLIVYSSKVING